jgi:hypothetical protein
VRSGATGTVMRGNLVLASGDPSHVSLLSFAPEGTGGALFLLSAAERRAVLDRVAKLMANDYVMEESGSRASKALRSARLREGFAGIADGEIFATRLTDDLRALTHDRHMWVGFSIEVVPPDPPAGPPAADPEALEASHCGIGRTESLEPNIGYLELTEMADSAYCGPRLAAAMTKLADSAALIIDLRDNHGGAIDMVPLLGGYLFEEPTHLDDLYTRHGEQREAHWSPVSVPGRRFLHKPVYILQSARTFSAAEELSYDLKVLGRATIVGETSGGGAHTVSPHRIGEHFWIGLPFATLIQPTSKANWEGVGVVPDIKVDAADALKVALRELDAGRAP